LRLWLALIFAPASAIPALLVLSLGSDQLVERLPELPLAGESAPLLVVLVGGTLGAGLGLLLARLLLAPLAALAGAMESLAAGDAPAPLPASPVRELARLTDAVARLRGMYRAEELGRDRHVIVDASLHGRALALRAFESDFRLALERGELGLHYQPIVGVDDGPDPAVRGMEALVRWQHPRRGPVPPMELVRFAEESGLIVPLGEWVLRRAIEQMREWRPAGVAPPRISVNLSARQLQHRDLAERIAALLDEAGLDPASLELELTEGVVAEQAEIAVEALKRLRACGIRLAVDDFGTGYSSLAYLKRFPVSTVKIDRTFLVDIQHDRVNQAIVSAVTTLAHSIGMRVVAEGIETAEQLERARSLGCDEAQGFLISPPLPSDEATKWLGEQRARQLPRPRWAPVERGRDVARPSGRVTRPGQPAGPAGSRSPAPGRSTAG
jgi:EAL domain-containing protein (putative c-di-GMP-specific phosphodiesterase class I)/HAMP domain-containing protein